MIKSAAATDTAKRLRPVGLFLALLVLLASAGWSTGRPSHFQDAEEDLDNQDEADWTRSLIDRLRASTGDPFDGSDDSADEPELQVEATKRSWIAELSDKADRSVETADLIEEIQSRTSSSGLNSLKAACKKMCPKCVCGVILMPSLPKAGAPAAPAAKPKVGAKPPKKPATPPKKPAKPPAKPGKPPMKPTKPPAKPGKPPKKPAKPPKKPGKPEKPEKPEKPGKPEKPEKNPAESEKSEKKPSSPSDKETAKKAKKSLQLESLERELPDFLLDEDGDQDVFKREVGDHDPMSAQAQESINSFGVE